MSTTDSDPTGTAAPGPSPEADWTVASLIRRHKRASGIVIALVLAVIAVTVITTVDHPGRQPLSDSASCSQWAAATPAQQTNYSHLYLNEYGRVANTAAHAASVKTAINQSCTEAAYLGEADDVSIIASLKHAF